MRGKHICMRLHASGCCRIYASVCIPNKRQLCCQRLLSSRGLISPRTVYNTQECKAVMICGLLACFNGVERVRLTVLPLPDHYTELTRENLSFCDFSDPKKKDMDLINGGDNSSLHFVLLAGSVIVQLVSL